MSYSSGDRPGGNFGRDTGGSDSDSDSDSGGNQSDGRQSDGSSDSDTSGSGNKSDGGSSDTSSDTGTQAGEDRAEREARMDSMQDMAPGSLTSGLVDAVSKNESDEDKQSRLEATVKGIESMPASDTTAEQKEALSDFKAGYSTAQAVDIGSSIASVTGPIGSLVGGVASLANKAYNSFAGTEQRAAGAEAYGADTSGTGLASKAISMATGVPTGVVSAPLSAVTSGNYGGRFGPAEASQAASETFSTRSSGNASTSPSLTAGVTAPAAVPAESGFSPAAFNPAYELSLMRSGA